MQLFLRYFLVLWIAVLTGPAGADGELRSVWEKIGRGHPG